MSGFKSVLIAGASGFVGKRVTKVFLTTPGWNVHILASPDSLTNKKAIFDEYVSQGAKIITADVSKPETYTDQIKGIDVVISSLAAPLGDSQITLAKAAKQAGVKLFLPSEYGMESTNIVDNPIVARKLSVRKAIEELELPHMYIVTGPFYEHLLAWTSWGVDVKNKTVTQIGDRNTKVTTVSIGEAVAHLPQIVNDPSLINKSVFLGHTTTTGEIFDGAVAAIGNGVQTSSVSIAGLNERIAKAASFAAALPDYLLLSIAKGQAEVLSPIDGSKYGSTFSKFGEFAHKFVPLVANGSFDLGN